MSTTSLVTAAELLDLPTGMGKRYELITGELRVMSPSGWRHGKIVSRLNAKLASFVEKLDLGIVFGAETGFLLASNPDTVRAPDVSFVSKQNVPKEEPQESFWPGAPDLSVEVLSPSDRTGEVDEKIEAWLTAGCAAVWVVDPKLRTVAIYRPDQNAEVRSAGQALTGEPILPGFSYAVDELFK
jgi:Uma2 family endonuclease